MSVNFDELNYLASKLDGMAESRLELFAAVLETRRHCDDVNSLINILENHYCFNLDPVSSLNEYGDYLADRECDEYAGLVKKLAKSNNPEMQEFAAYISRLEKSLDTESYAKTRAEEENGSFTEHGYLTEGNGFTEIYHGPEDIPAEYRVFDYPDPDPSIKVENTDLSVLLLKMHALGGSCMTDAGYNLSMLAEKHGSEYLMLMNGQNIILTEAVDVYRRGTMPFQVWTGSNDSPDTRAYAIHVKDQYGDGIIGDIVELNLAECQYDIFHNSAKCTEVYATLKNGSERKYSADEWRLLEPALRDRIQNFTEQFDSDGMRAVVRHLEDTRREHTAGGKAVEPEAFLSDLNTMYMSVAPHPQPEMLRVYQTVAKEILARGDAAVYSLLPDGAKLLTPVDAVKYGSTTRYPGHLQFAVKKEDFAGIDKWAKREVDTLNAKRQAEHEAQKKPKNKDQEL